jgi:hypothetical protein
MFSGNLYFTLYILLKYHNFTCTPWNRYYYIVLFNSKLCDLFVMYERNPPKSLQFLINCEKNMSRNIFWVHFQQFYSYMWSSIITEKFTVPPTFTHLSYFDNQVGEAREVVIMAYMWSTVTATKKLPRNPLTTLTPSPNPPSNKSKRCLCY